MVFRVSGPRGFGWRDYFDILSFLFIAVALVVSMFLLVGYQVHIIIGFIGVLAVVMIVAGIVIRVPFASFGYDPYVSAEEFSGIVYPSVIASALLSVVIGVVSAIAGFSLIPFLYASQEAVRIDKVTAFVIYIVMAIAEETFFAFGLTGSLLSISRDRRFAPVAIVITAVIFAIYHVFVYGGGTLLIIMFIGRIFFSWVYVETRRVSASMITHITMNALASLSLLLG